MAYMIRPRRRPPMTPGTVFFCLIVIYICFLLLDPMSHATHIRLSCLYFIINGPYAPPPLIHIYLMHHLCSFLWHLPTSARISSHIMMRTVDILSGCVMLV